MKNIQFSLFFLFSLLTVNNLYSQKITPYAINIGGGSSSTTQSNANNPALESPYLFLTTSGGMEWSLGESVSIAHFIASGYSLNTGVLQPMTSIVTAINEYGPAVFGTQITIGPNPTSNLLHIKARFNQVGSLSFQLIDAKSSIMFTQDAGTIFNSYDKDILMENYPPGVFYMKVYFKPSTGIAKTGIYKIIKL
jgi:hypothetical protein